MFVPVARLHLIHCLLRILLDCLKLQWHSSSPCLKSPKIETLPPQTWSCIQMCICLLRFCLLWLFTSYTLEGTGILKDINLAEQSWAQQQQQQQQHQQKRKKKQLKATPTIAAATKVAEVIWESRNRSPMEVQIFSNKFKEREENRVRQSELNTFGQQHFLSSSEYAKQEQMILALYAGAFNAFIREW